MATLLDVFEEAAADTPEVEVVKAPDGSMTWAAHGRVFAELSADGSAATFLLDPIVAGAAARTPEVSRSARGPGWVEMRPKSIDGHVADRAGAWFISGYRRLTGPGG